MKEVEQPATTAERRKVAVDFLDDLDITIPALLDSIDDQASKAYVSLPDRMYLIGKDGKIAYAGNKGPHGFKPDELVSAIEKELGGTGSDSESAEESPAGPNADSPRRGGGQRGQRGRGMARFKFMQSLDQDQDGVLSGEELKKASEALKGLDQNGDGALDSSELMFGR